MRMIGLYYEEKIPNLEDNHRRYCEKHGISYEKTLISQSLAEKYSTILYYLQKYKGEKLIFIDSLTWITQPENSLKFDKFVPLQFEKKSNILYDHILFFESSDIIIRIFYLLCNYINKTGFYSKDWRNILSTLPFPKSMLQDYPQKNNNTFINVNILFHNNWENLENIFSVSVDISHTKQDSSSYLAEAICGRQKYEYTIPKEPYSVYNPGNKNAIITMHTPEIKSFGVISEESLREYCEKNQITLYAYREVPDFLKEKNISGTWCKPWLLMKHFESHEYVAWCDSDILISKDYKMQFEDEIQTYQDPYYELNAGFMIFRTSEKNRTLIESVIEELTKIDGELSGVYSNNGGDQPRFIKAFQKFYPEVAPNSFLFGNTHPFYPKNISPYDNKILLHFMSLSTHMRYAVMDGYFQIMKRESENK